MRLFFFILFILYTIPSHAQIKEYEHAYDIDLKEEIPLIWRLKKEYKKETAVYDWQYQYGWHISSVFNYKFKNDIKSFGTSEKRLNNADEDSILAEVKRMPKVFYPYIGPVLHTMRGLSGKVLDLPGIKETKNKFPDKIASLFQDIPNIEFASPEMYIFLNPLIWGENLESLEFPKQHDRKPPKSPRIHINPQYIQKMKEKIKISDFTGGKKAETPMGIRHIMADKDTPLSPADVKAFINTLDGIKKFSLSGNNGLRMLMTEPLITYWDTKNGTNKSVAFLKNFVNPCQSMVRNIKWSGLRSKFQDAIGVEAFGLDDWAYTCDKIIKAYRVSNLPFTHLSVIKSLRAGSYYKILDSMEGYSDDDRREFRNFLEATIHMYDTTSNNLESIRSFKKELRDKIISTHFENMGVPIIFP